MKSSFKYFLTGIFLFTIRPLTAQVYVKASVDKNQVVIGEPITLTLEAYIPLGQQSDMVPTRYDSSLRILKKDTPRYS